MKLLNNIYAIRLRDLEPYVKEMSAFKALKILDANEAKIQEMVINKADEKRWRGIIKFYYYPVAQSFEADNLKTIFKYFASMCSFVNNLE